MHGALIQRTTHTSSSNLFDYNSKSSQNRPCDYCVRLYICLVEICLILHPSLSEIVIYLLLLTQLAASSFPRSLVVLWLVLFGVVTRNHLVFTILDFVSNFVVCNNFVSPHCHSMPFTISGSSICKCMFRCNLRFFLIDFEERTENYDSLSENLRFILNISRIFSGRA